MGVGLAVRRLWLESVFVFAGVLAIYLLVTPHTNGTYRHYVYMASAFLHGRVDLRGVPDYYHDIIIFQGRLLAPFPPFPALLLAPVVALQGQSADQGRVGQVIAALAVAVFIAGLRRLGFSQPIRLFCGAALAFGSVLWPATSIGTTWFFAHEVVVLATALLIWEFAGAARPLVLGIATVAAWLTRVNLLAAVPVVAALLWFVHRKPRGSTLFLAINALGVVIYLAYNFLRFGDFMQPGYRLLSMAGPSAETVARWGFFNLQYIPEHVYTMVFRAPELIATAPYLRPSPLGMSLLFTSPLTLRVLFAPVPRHAWVHWGVLIAALTIPILLFFSTGWVQFGYRYSLDWWVFLLVLVAHALNGQLRRVDYALLCGGIIMNALGVYWVRALGW